MNKLLKILQWVVVVFFGFMTLGCLLNAAVLSTILLLLCTVFCIPKTQEIIRKKVIIKLRVKIIATIVVFIVGIGMLPSNGDIEETKAVVEQQTLNDELNTEELTTENSTLEEVEAVTKEIAEKSIEESNTVSDEQKGTISTMEVHFIDVGQGDSTLIKCGGKSMLIDAGDDSKGTTIQNYLQKQGVTKLDYLILTHPDADHIGGAPVIITKLDIDTVFMSNYEKDNKTYMKLIQALDNKLLKWSNPEVGSEYKLDNASFTIIAPNGNYSDPNNASVGIILKNGENRFLFTGDAEEEAESDFIDNGIDIGADVYQVGHHGSKTASNEKLLAAVNPKFAVISCAEGNEYGHPHAKTLNSLRSMGVKVFRTDEQGSIVATSDGADITWNCAPSESWQAGEPTKSTNDSNTTNENDSAIVTQDKVSETEISKTEALESDFESQVTESTNTNGIEVHITETGKKYHSAGCRYLKDSDIVTTLDKAKALGLGPCSVCNPPQ